MVVRRQPSHTPSLPYQIGSCIFFPFKEFPGLEVVCIHPNFPFHTHPSLDFFYVISGISSAERGLSRKGPFHTPRSSKHGTQKTIKATFGPWLSEESPGNLLRCSLFARKRTSSPVDFGSSSTPPPLFSQVNFDQLPYEIYLWNFRGGRTDVEPRSSGTELGPVPGRFPCWLLNTTALRS